MATKTTRFQDPEKRAAYENAHKRHQEHLMRRTGATASAYKLGYLAPDDPWPKTWTTYPVWCAGRDRRREDEGAGEPIIDVPIPEETATGAPPKPESAEPSAEATDATPESNQTRNTPDTRTVTKVADPEPAQPTTAGTGQEPNDAGEQASSPAPDASAESAPGTDTGTAPGTKSAPEPDTGRNTAAPAA